MALDHGQRVYLRRTVNATLRTPCTIKRAGTLLNPQPTMPLWSGGGPLRCSVSEGKKDARIPGADATQTMQQWIITLPDDMDIRAGDHILALGIEYSVDHTTNPTTDSADTTALCWALWSLDAQGTPGSPLYLRPNATVSVTRGGVQIGPSSLDVRLEKPPELHFTAMGGERYMYVLFAMGTDVQEMDDIRILTYGQVTFPRPGPYEAQDVLPVGEPGLISIRARIVGFTL